MRASRLINILTTLQARGRVTAEVLEPPDLRAQMRQWATSLAGHYAAER